MLKVLAVVAIIVAVAISDEAKPEEVEIEDGVLVLTEKNFDTVVEDNEFVLVEFYAPWCGHCKSLAPEYAKAAQKLAEEGSPIRLGKVDATIESALGTKYEVRGYPTLKFFRDGVPSEYTGGRTEDTIVSWLKKKSGPPAATIASKEDAQNLQKESVAVIGFFTDVESDAAKAFLKVAAGNDDILFGICSDADLMKEYNMEGEGVSVFKDFDDKRADMTEDFTVESITVFVKKSSTPLLTEFSPESAQKIFGQKDTAFFFLAMAKSSEGYEAAGDVVRAVAKDYTGRMIAVALDTESATTSQVLQYMDLKEGDYPTYRLLNLEKNLKYKPETDELTVEKVGAFVEGYFSGEVRPFLKTQDTPEDWDAQPVKVLTGKNFKEVAFDDSKNVFVEFYAPWCGHCKKLSPIWDELAQKYEDVDDVVIAKVDSTLNELEEVSVKGFPTLKMFPANSDGKIDDYSGDRSLDDLLKFVAKYSPLPAEDKDDSAPEAPKESSEEGDKKKDEL